MNSSLYMRSKRQIQRGLTMVEILVAMVLMLLVTLATVTLYSVNSQSFKTVDASQELNDSARFAFEVIGQSLRNAGYQEYMARSTTSAEIVAPAGSFFKSTCTYITLAVAAPLPCPIVGFHNSTISDANIATLYHYGTKDSGGVNASDTLAVSFYGSGTVNNANTVADGSMVDCQGVAQAAPRPDQPSDVGLSLFWIRTVEGEPQLSCISRGAVGPGGTRNSQAIVRGMETFQVMYGLDVNGNIEIPSTLLPDRWVSAAAMDTENWANVRAVRIGFVLRGAPGSAQRPASGAALTTAERTYWPMGRDFTDANTEAGMVFVAPDDSRLRRAYSTTFMIRNGF
jgi:type IV pilus assembly protein PilW